MLNNPDFRFTRMRKSGKTEFFKVHIERAVITQLENSVVRDIPHFLATCVHAHCAAPNQTFSKYSVFLGSLTRVSFFSFFRSV